MTADTNNDAAINITTQNVTLVDTINVLDNGDAAIAATSGAVRTSVSQLVHMLQLLRLMLLGSMAITDDDGSGVIDDSDESAAVDGRWRFGHCGPDRHWWCGRRHYNRRHRE